MSDLTFGKPGLAKVQVAYAPRTVSAFFLQAHRRLLVCGSSLERLFEESMRRLTVYATLDGTADCVRVVCQSPAELRLMSSPNPR